MRRQGMKLAAAMLLAAALLGGCAGGQAGDTAQTGAAESTAQTSAAESTEQTSGAGDTAQKDAAESGMQADKPEKGAEESGAEGQEDASDEGTLDLAAAAGKHHVEITVKDYGTIDVELDGDAAPITVANFLDLAGDGFYDGLTFHRIISGFMIQGGDPLGNGMGGSDWLIKGEFAANGIENNLSHTRGAISMARSQMPDSASSQFFIVHEDSQYLDGQYACFGYVTEGMEVVDAICEDTPVEDDNGTVAAENQPVIESIVVLD